MRDVLCIYYSRTGNTKRVMETIAKEMDAELLALTDGVEDDGEIGKIAQMLDAYMDAQQDFMEASGLTDD